ncbi:PREDICTED: transcription factor bHLH118-like [Ipomoea nil]|uniref:transcription factor bHLH118-like n=1 Tax=Ipomoea nil TaxID=35883 RepID=UPI000900B382|nr:PREDICTED: transcription factor bHLH118-like [Ipomoea nil]
MRMDKFPHHNPFFPSQQNNEDYSELFSAPHKTHDDDAPFLFQTDPTLLQHQDLQFDVGYLELDDPVAAALEVSNYPIPDNVNVNAPRNKGKNKNKQQKPSAAGRGQGESSASDGKHKRVMHRDIERQRRQEMANLYASLRVQLPLEYLKGKRSTSDHVMEAVNYIEDKQKSIRELEEKRDRLKRVGPSGSDVVDEDYNRRTGNSSSAAAAAMVTVEACLDGVEIFINSGFPNQGFRISRALDLLVQQGHHVLSCVCSRVDDRLLHTIRVQVSPQAGVDLQVLQQHLSDSINLL